MKLISLDSVLNIDYSKARSLITEFISSYLSSSGAKGFIVGISGGVDSALTAALAVDSVGSDKVQCLIMPDSTVTPGKDVEDALEVSKTLGLECHRIDIAPIVDVYKSTIPVYEGGEGDRIALGNLRARIRASILYYYANKDNLLVLGTGDRSEYLIGYFTKYGDAAVDLAPILILYKSQVRRLAKLMGIPESIAYKPSSPRLWPGHLAEDELGLKYDEIDVILHARFDHGIEWENIPEVTGIPHDKVKTVKKLHAESEHKRNPPPSPPFEAVKHLFKPA